VEAYPSLRSAASLVGITPGALSRRKDVERISAGREERIPAAEVVRLAGTYRRRSPSRVAAELVERAIAIDPELEDAIGREVDATLERLPDAGGDVSLAGFLSEAHRLLPPALAAQVEEALHDDGIHGDSAVGWSPARQ
jgi:hypothetical protein